MRPDHPEGRADEPSVWCPVANVAEELRVGPAGRSIREGTRHFSGGAKVYCYPPLWGDGYEQLKVLGRHRGGRRLVEMVVPFRNLTHWRAKRVFHPFVVQRMAGHWDGTEASQRKAEGIARWGQLAEVCVHCRVEHRTLDVGSWWLFRRWPLLAYWDGQPGPVRIVAVSRGHDESGASLPGRREEFERALEQLMRLVQAWVGGTVEPTPTLILGGHLQSALRFDRPPSVPAPPTDVTRDAEAGDALRQLLWKTSSGDR